jgi:hypothetical protein
MKIEIVLDPSKPAPAPSLVARVANVPTNVDGTGQTSVLFYFIVFRTADHVYVAPLLLAEVWAADVVDPEEEEVEGDRAVTDLSRLSRIWMRRWR